MTKKKPMLGRDLLPLLTDALGLGDQRVRSITLHVPIDDFVRVDAELVAQSDMGDAVANAIRRAASPPGEPTPETPTPLTGESIGLDAYRAGLESGTWRNRDPLL